LADELRERAKKGDLTFCKSEVRQIASMLEKLSYRCAEAFKVVGALASDAGVFKLIPAIRSPTRGRETLSRQRARSRSMEHHKDRRPAGS
jgi:hypothetical protein